MNDLSPAPFLNEARAFRAGRIVLHDGDCLNVVRTLADNSIDSVVTDPPYAITFMGKEWDTGETAFAVEFWAEVLRVLKPGAHAAAFGGTRSYHRLACAIEDAGFEIRDTLMWVYGTGFPKSHDVSKGIDKAAGVEREVVGVNPNAVGRLDNRGKAAGFEGSYGEQAVPRVSIITAPATDAARQWEGWGTALKPAWEPICLARKPLSEKTVAANVLRWGTGAINVDGCRVGYEDTKNPATNPLFRVQNGYATKVGSDTGGANISIKPNGGNITANDLGRWPANLCHDGSDEVLAAFPESKDGVAVNRNRSAGIPNKIYGKGWNHSGRDEGYGGQGSAARFFYSAKASKADRAGSKHPTVKPVKLMQWLVRLITPPGGVTLDPFAGTGTTGEAAWREGMRAVLIEREAEYQADIARRMECLSSALL